MNDVIAEVPVPIAGLEIPKPGTTKIMVGAGTPIACTSCHRVGMEFYYLKRSNGKYSLLCFDKGKGCWEHSCLSLCSYVDPEEAQCTDLAEWNVVYVEDTENINRCVCTRHIPAVLTGATSYKVFPIDE